MPQNSTPAILERIQLVRYYSAKGYNGTEISKILAEKHGIRISARHVNQELKDIREGKYDNTSWLNDLLDIHYPEIYKNVLKELDWSMDGLRQIVNDPKVTKKTKLVALKAFAEIEVNKLNVLHKGSIVREMRKLKIKSRKIVEELATERAITRRNQKEDELFTNDAQKPVVSPPPPGMDDAAPPFGI